MLSEKVTVQALMVEFEKYLLEDVKSSTTVTSYLGDIRGFLEWLREQQVTFTGQLTRFYITSYKDYLIKNDYTINTINKKVNSLISFNNFLVEQDLTNAQVVYPSKDKIKIAAGSEDEIEVFTEIQIEQILFYLEDKEKVSERDKAVIKEYLAGERKDSRFAASAYLLLTQRAGKMNKDTVNKLMNKHGKELNMIMYPHKFRHTFCTRLINKGVELTTVSKLVGHSNIQTTAKFYINTSREDKQEAVDLL